MTALDRDRASEAHAEPSVVLRAAATAGWPEVDLPASDRPTIPVPAPGESGIRLKVAQVAIFAATVDTVVCDLSRDPRSETYIAPAAEDGVRKKSGAHLILCCAVDQNESESPPSTSTIRALK